MIILQPLFEDFAGYYSNVGLLCFFSMEDIFFMIFSTNFTSFVIFITWFQTVCLPYFYRNHDLLISKHYSFNNFNSHKQFSTHITTFFHKKIILLDSNNQKIYKLISFHKASYEQKDYRYNSNHPISNKSHNQLSIFRTSLSSRSWTYLKNAKVLQSCTRLFFHLLHPPSWPYANHISLLHVQYSC